MEPHSGSPEFLLEAIHVRKLLLVTTSFLCAAVLSVQPGRAQRGGGKGGGKGGDATAASSQTNTDKQKAKKKKKKSTDTDKKD